MTGEFDLIEWIRARQRPSPMVEVGVGDDLAVLRWPAGDMLLVGIDQVLDGVHFDSAIHSPRQIGAKAMNRNLSDCAAMGCLPAAAVVSVALPADYSLEKAKELYLGVREAGDVFDCIVVGGDTGSWGGKLVVTVAILGRSAGVRPVTRYGAKPGDAILVTGPLGGSILGRHLTFSPRIALGRQIAPAAAAMIDLSDGLSRDLAHICRLSGVGAVIQTDRVPVHFDALELSRRDHTPALDHALNDGEDYELLYTTSQGSIPGIRIGQIIDTPGVWLEDSAGNRKPIEPKGWHHPFQSP